MNNIFVTLTKAKNGIATHIFSESVTFEEHTHLAITEILIPTLFPQIKAGDTPYIQIQEYQRDRRRKKPIYVKTIEISTENDLFFENIADFLLFLNQKISFYGIEISYLEYNRRIHVAFRRLRNKRYDLLLNEQLNNILGGLMRSKTDSFHSNRLSNKQPDIHTGQYHIFLYSPAVKYSYLGDVVAPILRIVNVKNNKHDYFTHHIFKKPYYIPIFPGIMDQFQIHIKDEKGVSLMFPENQSIRICVHFNVLPL